MTTLQTFSPQSAGSRSRNGMAHLIEGRAWTPVRAVKTLVLTDDAARAFIGDRFYPLAAPEGTQLPLGVYRLSSTDRPGMHMSGNAGHAGRTVEVAFFSDDYDAMDAFAADFRQRVESWRGVEGEMKVRRIDIMDESDEPYDRPESGRDDPIYQRVFLLRIQHIEAATALPQGS